ncbi:hypothetical protein [Pseudomonas sp. JUb96]|uniref:hypothetical protein n=1 Tax=Pseudomonas sp. JUb96 TaxID=2940539 RepID=UPI0022273A4F|nr:hypothetical protein [Pseudomonas sp. JUb96]MCW2270871.1 hypothetical protein [Pseudomonas sp. JUb96]
MPTENRSSNTEQMVSVPRELLERCDFGRNTATALAALPELRAILAKPAAQHKSEQFTYSSKQATNCAGCGTRKHTPLRVDEMGGYVCLTCIDQKLESLLSSQEHLGEPVAWQYRVSAGPATGWSLWNPGKGEEFQSDYEVETRPLYLHPPTTGGFSAGDMADQGAKAFASRDPEVEEPRRALGGMLFAFDDGVGRDWSQELLDYARKLAPAVEFKPAE